MIRTLAIASTAALGLAALPLAAQAQTPLNWSGLYLGLHGGALHGDVSVHENSSSSPGGNISGFIGGALAGYNFPSSPVAGILLGVEADAGWATGIQGTGGGTLPPPCSVDYRYDLNWDAHFRIRAGLSMGNIMPFVAGGLAVADLNITDECVVRRGGIYTGATIGGGIDVKLAANIFARGELLFDVYGPKQYDDFSANFTASTARAAIVFMLP